MVSRFVLIWLLIYGNQISPLHDMFKRGNLQFISYIHI